MTVGEKVFRVSAAAAVVTLATVFAPGQAAAQCGGWGNVRPARSGWTVPPVYLPAPAYYWIPAAPAAAPAKPAATTPPAGSAVPEAAAGASVRVSAETSPGCHSCGSGTLVRTDGGRVLVLTSRHVVRRGGVIYLEFRPLKAGGPVRRLRARFLSCDARADLSVLEPAGELPEGAAPVRVKSAEASPGVKVWQVGYPGLVETRRSGLALPGESYTYGVRNYSFSLDTAPGDSGSGLITTELELCGVGWGGGGGTFYAVGVTDIRRHLRETLGGE